MQNQKKFLGKLEKNLFDLKKETLKHNKDIEDVNTLIWMIDGMRNSIGEEMLKTLSTKPEIPWKDIYIKTEYIWTYCNKCNWYGYVKKPKRDDPCPNCGVFDLKQHYILAKTHCNDCSYIEYAKQGVLKCVKCNSKNIRVIRKMEVSRTIYGRIDHKEKIKYKGSEPWPKDEKGNLIC